MSTESKTYRPPLCHWKARENDIATDLVIDIGTHFEASHRGSLRAHRVFLMAASPYFEEIIKENSCATSGTFRQQVCVPDMTLAGFTRMLRYMYTGEWRFEGFEQIVEALCAAIDFKMSCLAKDCRKALDNMLDEDPGGCLIVLENQNRLSEKDAFLVKKSMTVLHCRLSENLSSHWIELISFDTFDLLAQQYHPDVDEEFYFLATDRWATARCVAKSFTPTKSAKRDMAGGLQYLVRCNSFSIDFLTHEVANSGLLTDTEVLALIQNSHFAHKRGVMANPVCVPCRQVSREEDQMKMCFSNEPEGKEKMGKVIAMTWINAWKAYIDSNKNKESPGPINNLDILTGNKLKCDIKRDKDYVIVRHTSYKKLSKWYGYTKGQPKIIDDIIWVEKKYCFSNKPYVKTSDGTFDFTSPLPLCHSVSEIAQCESTTSLHQVSSTVDTVSNAQPIENLIFRADNDPDRRNGMPQIWNVPKNGVYHIEAGGARGGHYKREGYIISSGGHGATRKAQFRLLSGTCLRLVVGKDGGDSAHVVSAAGGGGGGTLVMLVSSCLKKKDKSWRERDDSAELLLAAGGGGGASCKIPGLPGLWREAGSDSAGEDPIVHGYGGRDGLPGSLDAKIISWHGGCGAGWHGAAARRCSELCGDSGWDGKSGNWAGGLGGMGSPCSYGGYGGGGGGAQARDASGAGGGYSGGGAGPAGHNGGGGGSFVASIAVKDLGGKDGGNRKHNNGFVIIKFLYD